MSRNHRFPVRAATIFALTLSVTAATARAQMPSPEQMAEMMKMQQCVAGIDPEVMQTLEARGKKIEAEVNALCTAGKRDEAQSKAIAYGREMAASEEMKALKKCGDMASKMVPQPAAGVTGDGEKAGHVCDQ